MKLKELFSEANGKHGIFLPYVCAGDPTPEFTKKLIKTLIENGAGGIEFGIPFSDPIADGETIREAISRALKNGMTPKKAFKLIKELREDGIKTQISIMTYLNIILAMNPDIFLEHAHDVGCDGLILPDLPYDESEFLRSSCKKKNISLIHFLTPEINDERLQEITNHADGFLYVVSVIGVTGARNEISNQGVSLLQRAKKITRVPLTIGFGVATPLHAQEYYRAGANGVIIGSQIVKIYSKYIDKEGTLNEENALKEIAEFTKKIVGAMHE